MRRVLRRTLTVLGGAAAGTAIAWAISSASASADPGCADPALPLPPVPALAQVAPVTDLVCAVGKVNSVLPVTDLGTAADDVAGLTPRVPIDIDQLGGTERHASSSVSGHGTHAAPARISATPTAPTSAVAPGIDPDALGRHTAKDRAIGDGMTRRGSPAPAVPFTPVPQPFAPGSGTSGHSGGADSPAFAALAWSVVRSGLADVRALPAAELLPVHETGTQPGVTPD
jgi:hypothetical protein